MSSKELLLDEIRQSEEIEHLPDWGLRTLIFLVIVITRTTIALEVLLTALMSFKKTTSLTKYPSKQVRTKVKEDGTTVSRASKPGTTSHQSLVDLSSSVPSGKEELVVKREQSVIAKSARIPSLETLAAESQDFWAGKSLEQLRHLQRPMAVSALQEFAVDFWPEDESTDEFLSFLAEQRHSAVEG